jgi:hypothetical protein
MMFGQNHKSVIDSTLRKNRDFFELEAEYKIKSAIMANESKSALGLLSAEQNISDMIPEVQDVLKEKGAKESVGGVDVKLNSLRRALINASDSEGLRQANNALALLSTLEEFTVIKGKKVPLYYPFAKELGEAIDAGMQMGNWDTLHMLMQEKFFKGSDLMTKGIEIGEVGGSVVQVRSDLLKGQILKMDELLDTIKKSAATARLRGLTGSTSEGSVRAILAGGGPKAELLMRDIINSQDVMETAIRQGWTGQDLEAIVGQAEHIKQTLFRGMQAVDNRMMGPVGAGIVGALAVGSLMGWNGYDPTPIVMPGETVKPQIQSAMALGNLLAPPDRDVASNAMDPGMNGFAGSDMPINSGGMYMEQPNTYQIRGELRSTSGLDRLVSTLNPLLGRGGSASIRITDTRRPISQTQVDYALGEY